MKSPDTTLGKWALHNRWVKWDLKELNKSGLPGNTVQQPPAQISILSLFTSPPICSHSMSAAGTLRSLCWGTGAGLCHQTWDLLPLPPRHNRAHGVQHPLLSPLAIKACAVSIRNKCNLSYHPGRNAENPTELCATPYMSLLHALALRVFSVLPTTASCKCLQSKPKVTSAQLLPCTQLSRQWTQ